MSLADLPAASGGDAAAELVRLRRDLDDLKGRQLVAGDSFVSYGMSSIFTWDFSATLSQNEQHRFIVTLHFARANGGAITKLNCFYRLDNPEVMADPMPRQAATNPNIDVKWRKLEDGLDHASWEIVVANTSATPETYTGFVKFFITSTTEGYFDIAA